MYNLCKRIFQVFEDAQPQKRVKVAKKITKQRLKNVALYYLQRFESSRGNLQKVLMKRITEYAYQNPDYDKSEALEWVEELLNDFEGYGYINDGRYAEIKIRDYVNAGKSLRYIQGKLQQKGIDTNVVENILEEQEYDAWEVALKFAKKKRIGPYRLDDENRSENRQKDMGALVRAGFDYDVTTKVLDYELEE